MTDQQNLVQELELQLDQCRAEAEVFKNKWLSTEAELRNYRKRVARDQENDRFLIKCSVVQSLLPIIDDLEVALSHITLTPSWINGIKLIHRKATEILEHEGITKIPTTGSRFNPNLHEALSHEPSTVESGTVLGAVQHGYLFMGKVLRAAKVRVAK